MEDDVYRGMHIPKGSLVSSSGYKTDCPFNVFIPGGVIGLWKHLVGILVI